MLPPVPSPAVASLPCELPPLALPPVPSPPSFGRLPVIVVESPLVASPTSASPVVLPPPLTEPQSASPPLPPLPPFAMPSLISGKFGGPGIVP